MVTTEVRNGHLLSPQDLAESAGSPVSLLPLDLIDPNPLNPRRALLEVETLARNIVEFGLMQPIVVRRAGDRYEVLGGHRRRAAFLYLRQQHPHDPRWNVIPALVVAADDERAELMLISAQTQLVPWKPREQAAALERLALAGLTTEQIGQRLQRTQSWASKRLRVYSDSVLSGYVQSGQLSPGVAEELLPVKDADIRRELAAQAVAEDWTQDTVKSAVRALRLGETADIARQVRAFLNVLSGVDGRTLSVDAFRDLWTIHGRVEVLAAQARGDTPKIPSIADAEKVAGVTDRTKARAEAQRRKTRRRAMPRPA